MENPLTVPPAADASKDPVDQKLGVWRERLVDLTKRNPLLGLNRARTTKIQVLTPTIDELFTMVVIDEDALKMPFARKGAPKPLPKKGAIAPAAPTLVPSAVSTSDPAGVEDEPDQSVMPAVDQDGPPVIPEAQADAIDTPTSPAPDAAATPAPDSGAIPSTVGLEDEPAAVWIVAPGDVTLDVDDAQLFSKLRRLRDNSRTTVAERGVTTLHLTLGTVTWTDPVLGESKAPLVLVPCSLERSGADRPLTLVPTDDEPTVNPALAILVRERTGKVLPEFPEEPTPETLREMISAVTAMLGEGYLVSEEAWLGTFSFETLAMWRDLGVMAPQARQNAVVQSFAKIVPAQPPDGSEALGNDLDVLEPKVQAPLMVLPADSSQYEALIIGRRGKNLLVNGPPGTGKSQTITNIIADTLANGQTVLFVSAKSAALEVVHERLRKLGLGQFVLEAHSTQSGRMRIMDDLKETLRAAGSAKDVNLEEARLRYMQVRDRLNLAVRELHATREPMGVSVYTGLGRYAKRIGAPDVAAALPWPDLTLVTPAELQTCVDALAAIQAEKAVYDARATHPWRGCVVQDAGLASTERVVGALTALRTGAAEITAAWTTVAPVLGEASTRTVADLQGMREALALLADAQALPAGWESDDPTTLATRAATLRDAAERATVAQEARAAFAEHASGTDYAAAATLLQEGAAKYGGFLSRMFGGYGAWKSQVQQVVQPRSMNQADMAALATLAANAATAEAALAPLAITVQPLLSSPESWRDPEVLRSTAARWQAASVIRAAVLSGGGTGGSITPEVRAAAGAIGTALAPTGPFAAAVETTSALFPADFADEKPLAQSTLGEIIARSDAALAERPRLAEWVRTRAAMDRARAVNLGPFIDAVPAGSGGELIVAFERRFWQRWADAWITAVPALREFSGEQRVALIAELRKADDDLRKLAGQAAVAGASRAAARVSQSGDANKDSQLGILKRELQKKRPRPLRRLFTDIPDVLQSIKPCMMMSPVSVSTFLQPGLLSFDVVVFDEASQLPPAEAIPTILRGRQVIVAGDDKQLPPTAFFDSSIFDPDEEDDEEEQLESLLRECAASVGLFQPATLKWHYRSRDERLIAFSNHEFYQGELITFPGPGFPEDRGVKLAYVADGVWDRGGSRKNRAEARMAADLAIKSLEEHPERSVGVVAMNVTQKEAIEDALAERVQDRPELRDRIFGETGEEPFFVKALENVQGDERDVIIISVGYGKDAKGGFSLNFGPLNREGGWRRLNVLITRARYQTVLVTSLRSGDLAGVSPDNLGVKALASFIAYCERGGTLPDGSARITNAETNDFEDAIKAALEARGMKVDAQVGASAYRIDLAVRDPRDESKYVLGVECDGATYHSSRTARDRDLNRQSVLEGMGWKLVRIWSTDWFADPTGTMDRVEQVYRRAIELSTPETNVAAPVAPTAPQPTTATPPVDPPSASAQAAEPTTVAEAVAQISQEQEAPAAPHGADAPAGIPYPVTAFAQPFADDLLRNDAWRLRLGAVIGMVVKTETPVHPEVVLDRVKDACGKPRATANVRSNFEAGVQQAMHEHGVVLGEDGFLRWGTQSLATFRIGEGATLRPVDQIPAEEITMAAVWTVEQQFGMPKEALVVETAKTLGYTKKPNAESVVRISTIIDDALDRGVLRQSGNQVVTP